MKGIDEIRACVTPLLVAKGATRAVLFGSIARGTDDGRSDVDLLVVDNDDLRYFARLDKYYDELVDLLHRPVDLFVYREAEIEALRDRPFVRRVLAEGKVIFE
jgi:predicted nucleotidyltransferase